MPQNDQIWPKIDIFGQFGPGHAGLFNALFWVGWWLWRAGCISQDNYLLYYFIVSKSEEVELQRCKKVIENHNCESCHWEIPVVPQVKGAAGCLAPEVRPVRKTTTLFQLVGSGADLKTCMRTTNKTTKV